MQGMRKWFVLVCVCVCLITVSARVAAKDLQSDNKTPMSEVSDNNPDIVKASIRLVGYYCVPDGDPVVDARIKQRLQEAAVANAESQCSWINGRPNVERISEWTFKTECRLPSTSPYGVGEAQATFRCNPK